MDAIAKGCVASAFALTQEGLAVFLRREGLRLKLGSGMGAVAKRLIHGFAASTLVIGFAGFEFDGNGFSCSYLGFVHDVFFLVSCSCVFN